jgi:hypothetical protein
MNIGLVKGNTSSFDVMNAVKSNQKLSRHLKEAADVTSVIH